MGLTKAFGKTSVTNMMSGLSFGCVSILVHVSGTIVTIFPRQIVISFSLSDKCLCSSACISLAVSLSFSGGIYTLLYEELCFSVLQDVRSL